MVVRHPPSPLILAVPSVARGRMPVAIVVPIPQVVDNDGFTVFVALFRLFRQVFFKVASDDVWAPGEPEPVNFDHPNAI